MSCSVTSLLHLFGDACKCVCVCVYKLPLSPVVFVWGKKKHPLRNSLMLDFHMYFESAAWSGQVRSGQVKASCIDTWAGSAKQPIR